ncbi:hypothetical protein [Aquimarina pacifica]|uniref:hypothetical protein n=1 Tax=Aquimarina pacifica TaxID=1296415 RepID=UPI00046EC8A8|nr:hypothetical protein [Aquimarina pacifica]
MRKTVGLKITAGLVGVLFLSAGFVAIRNRKRDHLASDLYTELSKRLNPTKGVENEEALDIAYMNKVLNQVHGNVLFLNDAMARNHAKRIHDAFRAWYFGGDKEDQIYAVLRNLKDKVQVSQVAKAYHKSYQLNLKDQLQNRLDGDEIKTALSIIATLPSYRIT